jgi:hypothetical protein
MKQGQSNHINPHKLFYYITLSISMHLTIHLSTRKINNMQFVELIILSDFMQVLNIKMKHSTQSDYFLSINNFICFIYY